mmetsp:Transcript_126893/g.406321  ORF Transcript_126893/g.406321 Transcript_126893/m.406321 type:complete len:241 (+) Transcript_126893:685-1407(+)
MKRKQVNIESPTLPKYSSPYIKCTGQASSFKSVTSSPTPHSAKYCPTCVGSVGPNMSRKKSPNMHKMATNMHKTQSKDGRPMTKPTSMFARSLSMGDFTSFTKRITRMARNERNITADLAALAMSFPWPRSISMRLQISKDSCQEANNVMTMSPMFQDACSPRKYTRGPRWTSLYKTSSTNVPVQKHSNTNQPMWLGWRSTLMSIESMLTKTTVDTTKLTYQLMSRFDSLVEPLADDVCS